ncbi:MAG: low molecular weight protein-tyrosine-phosphatase [Saprospiraceae bacterium]|nr:low molecular weight protein-tyrosine-phosphatase [Saprospiraceae bacterium]
MRVLMVCLGNICRSPLAEGILKQRVREAGLLWEVDSAGTGHWHTGELPDRRSVAIARTRGIDITDQRARQFKPADFDRFDRILVMDTQNLRDVLSQAGSPGHMAKVSLIMDALFPGEERIVPDPYYDNDGFEQVFDLLDAACRAFIEAHRA